MVGKVALYDVGVIAVSQFSHNKDKQKRTFVTLLILISILASLVFLQNRRYQDQAEVHHRNQAAGVLERRNRLLVNTYAGMYQEMLSRSTSVQRVRMSWQKLMGNLANDTGVYRVAQSVEGRELFARTSKYGKTGNSDLHLEIYRNRMKVEIELKDEKALFETIQKLSGLKGNAIDLFKCEFEKLPFLARTHSVKSRLENPNRTSLELSSDESSANVDQRDYKGLNLSKGKLKVDCELAIYEINQ